MTHRLTICVALAFAGCGPAPCTTDGGCTDVGGRVDAGARREPDAGSPDAGLVDAGGIDASPADTGPADAGPADAGSPDASPPDAGPPEPSCDDLAYPPGLSRSDLDYEAVSSQPFGVSTHTNLVIELSETSYASIAFRTPSEPFARRLAFEDAPTSHNQVDRVNRPVLTISSCPEDFTESALCRYTFSRIRNLFISTDPDESRPYIDCQLQPGTDYFINLVASDAPLSRAPSCTDSELYDSRRCAILFSESVLLLD
ncbi:MAG: hypothetical protein AB8I08_16485 [Sandaracinaceae bacterium]